MFDVILQNVATRFGISLEKAKQLLGMLIAIIFNEKRGGPAGFVDLFRSQGLGDMVASWIGNGANQPISPAQLESALGGDLIGHMANRAGVDRAVAGSALSAMLPDVFHHLTEDGQIPVGTTIPDRLRGYVDDIGDFVRDLGAGILGAGAAAVGAVGAAANKVGHAADRAIDNTAAATRDVARETKSGLGKLLPWILLAGIVLLGLFALNQCKKAPVEPTTPPPTTPAVTEQATPAATAPSRFSLETDGTKATVNGQVASDAEKTRLWDALKKTFGEGNVNGDIVVDAKTAPAGWMDSLIALLPDLKAKGLKFAFEGDKLKLDTSGMSEADRFTLTDKFRAAFRDGKYEISGLWDRAMAALAGLKDGFSSADLVKGLNLMNVYFATGSATITNDSFETLKAAADAIKRAPAGTKIEAGGYTDNTGDAAANVKLSQERSDAVVAKLKELGVADGILSGKGYGDANPIGDNKTEEGRAKNRRMEFKVL